MEIRVAVVGVGNCASALVQGLTFYGNGDHPNTGLMHPEFGPYRVGDIVVVAAFDVDENKVGLDVSDAIFVEPNNTIRYSDVPASGVLVSRGPTADGLGEQYRERIVESDIEPADVAALLIERRVEVLVLYLPVGSEEAAHVYAEAALDAGVAVVNALPVFLASDPVWEKKFRDHGIPIVGDDVKSQVGATITHRALVELLQSRGMVVERTYQLNVGGNMDFANMLEGSRLLSKRVSKTRSVTSAITTPIDPRNVRIGPSDYVPWLTDRKVAFVRVEGTGFGGAPLGIEMRLEVWDSPNSAGVVVDAIRAARCALDSGLGGALVGPSAYFMKSPPVQMSDEEARGAVEEFILDHELTNHKAPETLVDLP